MYPIQTENMPLCIRMPVVTGAGHSARSVTASWQLFFPDDLLIKMTACTNIKIAEIRMRYSWE